MSQHPSAAPPEAASVPAPAAPTLPGPEAAPLRRLEIGDTLVNLDWYQDLIGHWAEQTFPKQTDHTIALHLGREVAELRAWTAAAQRSPVEVDAIAEEAADCLILLLALAHRCDFSLLDAVESKMAVNLGRLWGAPDAEGVVEHVPALPTGAATTGGGR